MAKPFPTSDYPSFLSSIKERTQRSQLKALVAANRDLVILYWYIGRSILERQAQEDWGAEVIDKLSQDLQAEFPQMRLGFSPQNLKYMQLFAETYPDKQFVQEIVAQLPWGHNLALLKIGDKQERLWYLQKAIKHGWGCDTLDRHIEAKLYQQQSEVGYF